MLAKLSQSEKFKKDFLKFKNGADKLKNTRVEHEYNKLLKEFVQLCKVIDDAHSSEYNGYVRPDLIKDKIFTMVSVRKKLENYLNDA